MGRWAQRQKRGGGGIPFTELPAPILVGTEPDQLDWTWTLADPDTWQIETADDIDGPFAVLDSNAGTERTYGPVDPTKFFRIIGMTAGNPVTSYSQVVTF